MKKGRPSSRILTSMTALGDIPAQLTPREAMEALRISYPTLRRMIDRGDLAAVKLGGGPDASLRIAADDLARFARPKRKVA